MTSPVPEAPVSAAGTVLYRAAAPAGPLEIAVIHRPKYRDWSLPKGKIDPGETSVLAAARETEEETGITARLERYLGIASYPLAGSSECKHVAYWAAAAQSGEFRPNGEVDQLRWLPADRARAALTYPVDREVLDAFTRIPPPTATLLLVRHAKAGRAGTYPGPDDERPLEPKGIGQAEGLVAQLAAFGAASVSAAPPVRCRQTVEPLARYLGVEITSEPLLGERGWAAAPEAAVRRATELPCPEVVRVVCSQGGVIPTLVDWWSRRDGVRLPPALTRKGSVWVLSFSDNRLVAADHLDRALLPQ